MLYIFDWDGTLSDSLVSIVSSFQVVSKALDLPIKTDKEVRSIIGLGLNEGIEILYPGNGSEMLEKIRKYYAEHYRQNNQREETLYPGSYNLLKQLSDNGHSLAVATGKSRKGLDRAMRLSNTTDFFLYTRTADEAPSKPNPQMLHDILDFTGVDKEQAVMIGDTTFDLEMACHAGIKSVGTSYGAHHVDALLEHNPIGIIDSIEALLHIQLD